MSENENLMECYMGGLLTTTERVLYENCGEDDCKCPEDCDGKDCNCSKCQSNVVGSVEEDAEEMSSTGYHMNPDEEDFNDQSNYSDLDRDMKRLTSIRQGSINHDKIVVGTLDNDICVYMNEVKVATIDSGPGIVTPVEVSDRDAGENDFNNLFYNLIIDRVS